MYHWEADQEDFLVLSGEAVLVIEGLQRPLRRLGPRPLPPGAAHVIVGAGDGPCVFVAVGSRAHAVRSGLGCIPRRPRCGASRRQREHRRAMRVPREAYAGLPRRNRSPAAGAGFRGSGAAVASSPYEFRPVPPHPARTNKIRHCARRPTADRKHPREGGGGGRGGLEGGGGRAAERGGLRGDAGIAGRCDHGRR